MAKKVYNADKNEFEAKKDSGSTPASNTRKKMKRAAEASKAKAPKKKAAAAKEKAPIPKDRPKKGKAPVKGLDLPSTARANASVASGKLKNGKPGKGKKGHGIAMGKYRLK